MTGADNTPSLLLQCLTEISGLSGQVGNLQGQATAILAEQARAAAGRAETHARLREVEGRVAAVQGVLSRVAPLVDNHEALHNKASGAAWAMRTLYGFAAGAGGAIAAWLGIKVTHG